MLRVGRRVDWEEQRHKCPTRPQQARPCGRPVHAVGRVHCAAKRVVVANVKWPAVIAGRPREEVSWVHSRSHARAAAAGAAAKRLIQVSVCLAHCDLADLQPDRSGGACDCKRGHVVAAPAPWHQDPLPHHVKLLGAQQML
eukprot:365632-Chlamydomonas_euryale.AAC.24